MRLVNRVLPPEDKNPNETKLFAPEGSAEGCASGECLPEPTAAKAPVAVAAATVVAPVALADDEPEEAPPPVEHLETDHDRWEKAVDAVRQASPRHGKSLSYARFVGFSPEGVKVAFAQDAAFHRSQVTGMSRSVVEAELSRALKRPIKLVEDTTPQAFAQAQKSIAEVEATDRASRERAIDTKVKEHPAIRTVLKYLGGNIEHVQYLEPAAAPKPALVAADEAVPTEE